MVLRLIFVLVMTGFSFSAFSYTNAMGACHDRGRMMLSDCEAIFGPATYNGGLRFSFCSHAVPSMNPCDANGICGVNFVYESTVAVVGCPSNQTLVNGQCENINPFKNQGNTTGSCPTNSSNRILFGNPINIGTGNKYQLETDYQGAGDFPLVFERTYNSDPSAASVGFGAGSGWRHSYERSISIGSASAAALYRRADGNAYTFTLAGTKWHSDADVNLQLSGATATGWQLTTEDGSVETYDAGGKLQSIQSLGGASQTLSYGTNGLLYTVTHSNGRSLNFTYDSASRVSTMQDSAGGLYQYSYNTATGNLETVTYPDLSKKTYLYNETGKVPAGVSLPHALTGIIDENNNRFATWTYDAQGRAVSSQHAGGAEFVSVSYGANSSTVTDALGTARTNSLQIVQGVVKSGGQSQPAGAGCLASAANIGYDANGNIASRTDFNGNLSCYAYDLSRNLETARLEGLAPGSSCPADLAAYTPAINGNERKISTQWHAGHRLPTQIDEAGRLITFSYDANGNLLQKTVSDTATQQSRSWSYTYNSIGQVLSEDGPRTDINDITSYSYYADSTADHKPGDLWKVTNALGHVTTFTAYDANGRLLSLTDPNGLIIGFGYDARGRLTQKTVDGNTTRYDYDPAGNLVKVTRPTGVFIVYTYDAAHRLTDITDALGGKIHYTLDLMGNRTLEEIFDATGTVVKTKSRQFDALSRLHQDIDAYNQATSYQYDANGNLTQITGVNGHVTQHQYDTLDRLIRSIDALAGITDYQYDAQDRITQVTDAANHSTIYGYNGLGDLTQLDSPNTGITQYSYDSAGNLAQKTDANNGVSHYSYDALNRLTVTTYPGLPAVRVVNTYDGNYDGISAEIPPNQIGRLTASRRQSRTTAYRYDLRGNLSSATGMALPHPGYGNTISYSYNTSDQLTGIAFSNYRDIQYQYDQAGKVSQVSVHDADGGAFSDHGYNLTRPLATNITHLPFGPVASLTYGNGLNLNRSYDQDYRFVGQTVGNVQNLSYGYDPVGNLQIANDLLAPANNQSYGYDPMNRLLTAAGPNNLTYSYDAIGSRTADYNNTDETLYHYDLGSQKLLSQSGARPDTILTDPAGNITQAGGKTYLYWLDQKLRAVKQGSTNIALYDYDARGQRILKLVFNGSGPTYFDYDPKGRLLNENGSNLSANYVYLDGEPLARVDYNLSDTTGNVANWNIAYYHNNPIGAPLQTTDSTGNVSWSGQIEPFGKVQTVNPNITQNLRFPGQYYDAETGLHYNMQRYYDPGSGRYLQSDPIGLAGGINTYTYVRNNPLKYADPLGLLTLQIGWAGTATGGAGGAIGGAGMAFDSAGNIGTYEYGGAATGVGLDIGGGISVQVSSASTINDLAGWFYNDSYNIGAGLQATLDGFIAPDGSAYGGGFTLGAGDGLSVLGGATWTNVQGKTTWSALAKSLLNQTKKSFSSGCK